MKNLAGLKEALESEVGNDIAFKSVAVRILLRTGVNLSDFDESADTDAATIEKVAKTAREMGYLAQ